MNAVNVYLATFHCHYPLEKAILINDRPCTKTGHYKSSKFANKCYQLRSTYIYHILIVVATETKDLDVQCRPESGTV